MDETSDSAASRAIFLFGVCFLLWMLLAGSIALDEVIAGIMVSAAVALLAWNNTRILGGVRITLGAIPSLLSYLFYFALALLRANVDMARRVLSPSLPLEPGMVEVRTDLQSTLGKLLLANSITLTPGTLSVDVEGDRLLVHWISCPADTDLASATRTIVSGFEDRIKGFLR